MLMSGNLTVWIFQSTLSVRRATQKSMKTLENQGISIHALRKESDATRPRQPWSTPDFNPRSP